MPRRPAVRPHSARPVPAIVTTVQPAEPRVMLSGNVDVTFDGDGVMTVQADQSANDLRIELNVDGDVTFDSGDDTTVNGGDAGTATVDIPDGGITGITVILGGGDDRIEIVGGVGGADGVQTSIGGDVLIRAGGDADDVSLSNLLVDGRVRVVGGPGDDVLDVANVSADDFSLEGGQDSDVIAADGLFGRNSLLVYGGRGEDTIVGRDLTDGTDGVTPRLYGGFDDDTLAIEQDRRTLLVKGNDGAALVVVEDGLDADELGDETEQDTLNLVFQDAATKAGRDILGQSAMGLQDASMIEGFPEFDFSQFQMTDSGLLYRIVDPGSDVRPDGNDRVNVRYQGLRTDGTQFDINETGGNFTTAGVVPGFGEGLQLIGEGGRIQMLFSNQLGYAEGSNDDLREEDLFFNAELNTVTPVSNGDDDDAADDAS